MLHMNRAFSDGGVKVRVATFRQDSKDTGSSSRPNAVMSGCDGTGCNFRPVVNSSLCFWMCSGHTELGCPPIGLANILHFLQFVRSANVLIHRSMTSLSCCLPMLLLHGLQMACVLSPKKFHSTDMCVC